MTDTTQNILAALKGNNSNYDNEDWDNINAGLSPGSNIPIKPGSTDLSLFKRATEPPVRQVKTLSVPGVVGLVHPLLVTNRKQTQAFCGTHFGWVTCDGATARINNDTPWTGPMAVEAKNCFEVVCKNNQQLLVCNNASTLDMCSPRDY